MVAEPKWLTLARLEIGTKEWSGTKTNPDVAQYYADSTGKRAADSVPWCAAFVGAMLSRAGVKPNGSLWARSYLNWGQKLSQPITGAVVVFSRGPSSGHVAFFIRDNGKTISVLGGNQSDQVSIANYPKSRILGYRWPEGKAKHGKKRLAAQTRKKARAPGGDKVRTRKLCKPRPSKTAR